MAFDVSQAALPALWKSDPGFVALAKHLYGDEVTLEDVSKDLFGKYNPNKLIGRFVHAASEHGALCGAKNVAKKTSDMDKVTCPNCAFRSIGKSDPGPSDVHVNRPLKRGKKVMTIRPQDDEETLEKVGKVFVDLVEKAYDAGLIDDKGNLNETEIQKSREYVRDHAGRFSSTGHHASQAGKAIAGLAAAGALAGTGAVVGTKAPKAMKYAGESIKYIGSHLKSSNPVERHVARALLPHALKSTGKAVGLAGVGATAAAGGVYEGTRTYQEMREHAVKKDWKKFDDQRKRENLASAGVMTAGGGAGVAALAHSGEKEHKARAARAEANQGDALIRHAFNEPLTTEDRFGPETPLGRARSERRVHPSAQSWADHASHMERVAGNAKELARSAGRVKRGGVAATAVGAGLVGLSAYEGHKARTKKNLDVTWEGDFSKVDEDKRQVFGWASVTQMDGKPVVDLQGDYIHPDDIEKAAYDYVVKARVGGDMHTRVDEYGNVIEKSDKPLHVSDLIESMVFTPEKCEAMGISKNLAGRWWTGFQINDPDVWESVKNGERTGFSIHGAGLRKSVEVNELDPEAELIGKAYQESDSVSAFIDNLCTLEDITGHQGFGDLAKHLSHGINVPQINAQQGRNAGVYGSVGSGVGGLTGGVIGAKLGHPGEGAGIGAGVGGLTGTALGVHSGKQQRPQRPPSVDMAMGGVNKAVDNTNRMGGLPTSRQGFYQQYALQQATEMLAPQVAQHIQTMQEQRWQQQMIEQQMLAQQAQQAPQDFTVRMGPYANQSNGQSQSNPLAPPQQSQSHTPTAPQPQQPQTMSI